MPRIDRLNHDAAKPEDKDKDLFITAFSDASHCPHTNAWGIGAYIRDGSSREPVKLKQGGTQGVKNSTQAEHKGLIAVIDWITKECNTQNRVIVLQCDSISALNMLDAFELKIKWKAKHVKLKHVKGHSGTRTKRSWVNNLCDEMAGKKMRKYRKQIQEQTDGSN